MDASINIFLTIIGVILAVIIIFFIVRAIILIRDRNKMDGDES